MTDAASTEDPQKSAKGDGEESFWEAAGGDCEDTMEEEASKVFALWELGDDFKEAIRPADGASEGDGEGGWSADAGGTEAEADDAAHLSSQDTTDEGAPPTVEAAPVATAPAPEPAVEVPTPAAPVAPAPEPTAAEPVAPVVRHAEDAVELPRSGSSRMFMVAGGAVVLFAIGGLVFAFAGGDDRPSGPSASANPPETEPATQDPAASSASRAAEAEVTDAPSGVDVEDIATGSVSEAESAGGTEPANEIEDEPGEEEVATTEPTVAPVAPPEPMVEPAVTTARLSVRTVPAGARLTIDGETVPNPYQGDLDIGSRHRLAATAEGFRAARQRVRMSEDRELVLTLRERPAPRPRVATSIGRRSGRSSGAAGRRSGRSGGRAGQSARRGGRRGSAFVTTNPYD